MRIVFIAAALLFEMTSGWANEEACLDAAISDYEKANVALMRRSAPPTSIQATVAQRRLQERYCLQVVHCRVGRQGSAPVIAEIFSTCLDDEARKHIMK